MDYTIEKATRPVFADSRLHMWKDYKATQVMRMQLSKVKCLSNKMYDVRYMLTVYVCPS